MLTELTSALRPAIVLLLLLAGVTGLAYPAAITGLAQFALPANANGSLIVEDGKTVGSALIAQSFAGPRYFHPRASAAGKGYDASSSAATNLSPGSQDLRDAIAARVAEARAAGITGPLPTDLVTTSASGLDPDLSPEAAFAQLPRVARARGLEEGALRKMVDDSIEHPLLGLIGDPHVNVLLLNRRLDADGANRQAPTASANPNP